MCCWQLPGGPGLPSLSLLDLPSERKTPNATRCGGQGGEGRRAAGAAPADTPTSSSAAAMRPRRVRDDGNLICRAMISGRMSAMSPTRGAGICSHLVGASLSPKSGTPRFFAVVANARVWPPPSGGEQKNGHGPLGVSRWPSWRGTTRAGFRALPGHRSRDPGWKLLPVVAQQTHTRGNKAKDTLCRCQRFGDRTKVLRGETI
jgi:hypothetical protein